MVEVERKVNLMTGHWRLVIKEALEVEIVGECILASIVSVSIGLAEQLGYKLVRMSTCIHARSLRMVNLLLHQNGTISGLYTC